MVLASSSSEANGKARLHPSYKEMILTAVSSMKERGGSSRRAISKFISTKYTDLSTKHDALLLCHLRRLHSKGTLLRLKNSYKLKPSLNFSSLADLAPRPPGRPKKVLKKPRGRPRANGVSVLNEKRKPGRPKKEKKGPGRPKKENGVVKKVSEKKNGRGRPKKEAGGSVQEVLEKKRSPGRPKKVKKSPGRPKKDVKASQDTLEKKESEGQPKEKKRPGRPRKEKEVEVPLESEDEKEEKEAEESLDGEKKEKEVQQAGEKKKGPGRPKKEVK